MATTTATPPNPASPTSLLGAIPQLPGLANSAVGDISQLLSGLPSPSWARTTNAYAGVSSGQPATGDLGTFIGNRGADIYHLQAQQNQQQGLQDLGSLIRTYSGTVAPTAGENLQNQQYYSGLQQRGQEFEQNLAEQQLNDYVNRMNTIQGITANEGNQLNTTFTTDQFGNITGGDPSGISAYRRLSSGVPLLPGLQSVATSAAPSGFNTRFQP
jgi:hypothetical protein